uniref:Protein DETOXIFICATION n=1 Tax=Odontella aurita TaxID=265563 RepID=A0A7S4MFZ3_9STRA|mmetsp:Transcript_20499/g.59435  ORF Transcript_20499/g.59435 Transcript_20499/m.59435 type:complete len:637 (+) Transcript_20499:128-2038(+)
MMSASATEKDEDTAFLDEDGDPSLSTVPRHRRAPFLDELRLQLRTALPTASSFLLNRIPWLISLAFVGRIGSDELAAAALATTLCNVTGMSLGVGLNSALTTLVGQAVGELRTEGDKKSPPDGGRRIEGVEEGTAVDDSGDEEKKYDGGCDREGAANAPSEEDALLPVKENNEKDPDGALIYKSFLMEAKDVEYPSLKGDNYSFKLFSMDMESPNPKGDGHSNCSSMGPLMPLAYLYRGIFVQMLFIIPVGIWWLTGVKSTLIYLGQGELVSAMTEQYLRILTPGLWSYGVLLTFNTWLQTVGMADVPLYASALGLAMHIPFNVFFIRTLGWGYLGAAAATVAYQMLQPVWICLYLFGTRHGRERALKCTGAWAAGYRRLTFRREARFAASSLPGILQYLSLGLPGIVVISEWWASEISIFLAGRLQPYPSYALDGMTIYQSLNSFCYMLPVGMAVAGGARVGQCLGGGDGDGARIACRVSTVGAALLSTTMGCILFFTPHTAFPSIFTSDEDVIDEASRTIPLLSIYVVADGTVCALCGAVKGCGRQSAIMPIVLIAYWIVGLPLAYYLAFVKNTGIMCDDDYFCGIRGLVGGMTTGTWTHMVLLAVLVAWQFDWAEEARKAKERLAAEKKASSQ